MRAWEMAMAQWSNVHDDGNGNFGGPLVAEDSPLSVMSSWPPLVQERVSRTGHSGMVTLSCDEAVNHSEVVDPRAMTSITGGW